MNQVTYGLHTGQAKKQISYREAKSIEMLFKNSFPDEAHACSQFFPKGISAFWIEEVVNKAGKMYWLHMKVNMARAIGAGEYCLMPYTVSNAKKTIRAVSKLLKKLSLDDRNADFGRWRWERLDSAFDVKVDNPKIFISLLDKSLDVNAAKKQCRRIRFTPANPKICESIRFGNSSYVYNIYIKLAELINKGTAITPDIFSEAAGIVRVERQNNLSAIKQLLPNCEVRELASKVNLDAVLKAMLDDIEAFWGRGDYYSYKGIMAKFSGFPEVMQLIPKMAEFTENSLETKQHLYTPDIKELFREYGIMPVGICKHDALRHQVHEIKGLYNMITDCCTIPDKRAYHVFPVPHQCSDGRYKAGITLHMVNDTRRQPVSVAGRTIEEFEKKVFKQLARAYAVNVRYHCSTDHDIYGLIKKSADDILRFYKVAETKSVKAMARDYIKTLNLRNK